MGYPRRQYFSRELKEHSEPLNNTEKRIPDRLISKGPEAEVSLVVFKGKEGGHCD